MSEEESAAFIKMLHELQAAANMSDAQLARATGANQSYLSRLRNEPRTRNISLQFARRAAGVFDELRIFLSPIDNLGTETYHAGTDEGEEGEGQ